MKFAPLDSWDYNQTLEDLLFFVQSIDEMLFDHTLDSYKVPALNTNSLCFELNETAQHIIENSIKPGAIGSIIDEFKYSLKNDPIAQKLLGENYKLIYEDLNANSKCETIINRTNYVLNIFSEYKYLKTAEEILKELVGNPNEKKLIVRVSRLFLTKPYINKFYLGFLKMFAKGHTLQFFETRV
ncbi:MAG: hypothetical protein JXN64_11630 [Spirochaetes bacterium]|nr:hypothetical protein [Spirochaetota bacterium]